MFAVAEQHDMFSPAPVPVGTDALHYVMETVRQTRADLPAKIPLIGFAGAPFTLASYAIEGGASRSYLYTKTLMYRDEGAWKMLMERLARAITLYLNAQIAAGAQAVQLFDSWVGCLGPDDYVRYVQPYVRQVFENLVPGVPAIHFGTGNPELLPHMAAAGEAAANHVPAPCRRSSSSDVAPRRQCPAPAIAVISAITAPHEATIT